MCDPQYASPWQVAPCGLNFNCAQLSESGMYDGRENVASIAPKHRSSRSSREHEQQEQSLQACTCGHMLNSSCMLDFTTQYVGLSESTKSWPACCRPAKKMQLQVATRKSYEAQIRLLSVLCATATFGWGSAHAHAKSQQPHRCSRRALLYGEATPASANTLKSDASIQSRTYVDTEAHSVGSL